MMRCLAWMCSSGEQKDEKPYDVEISVAVIGNVADTSHCDVNKYNELLFEKPFTKGVLRQAEMILDGVCIRFKEKEMYQTINPKHEPAKLSFYVVKPFNVGAKMITVTDDQSFFDSHEELTKKEAGPTACHFRKDAKLDREQFVRACFAEALTQALKAQVPAARKVLMGSKA